MQIKTTMKYQLKSKNPTKSKHWEDVGSQELLFINHGNKKYGTSIFLRTVKVYYKVILRLIQSSNCTESLLSRQITQKKKINRS